MWTTIHAERRALAADLEGLTPGQWDTPSLCAGWTVRDLLAHHSMQAKDVALERGASPTDTLARFVAEVDSSKHPPGPDFYKDRT